MRGNMGEAVGQLYVEKYFPPEAKDKARKIVESLLVAMKESINNLEWMSEETKKQALVKLSGFGIKIGYPDKWKDYTDLEITPDSYVANVMACNYFDHKESMSEINTAVKPWKWGMTPQTVHPYYSPTRNEIVFPAAILQFPFYDYRVDDAINYGAMGAVIGHEITHGFDDSGRKYDAEGNISEWWTDEDSKRFDEKAKMVVEQYNAYNPVDDLHINGELTLGENIADLGGITIAYDAFTKTEQFKKGEKIDGFTPQQRFFLGWAQIWKGNVRKEEAIRLLKIDSHSPGKFRVNGPFSNFPPFFEAFDVKEGDPMRRANLIKIW
jgi:putative endopeptidase